MSTHAPCTLHVLLFKSHHVLLKYTDSPKPYSKHGPILSCCDRPAQLTLAAEDPPVSEEPTVMLLETSKMLVADILPTPAGCVEARPGPPSHAPSKCGRERWRRFSSSSDVSVKNQQRCRKKFRVEAIVAAAGLGGGFRVRCSAMWRPYKVGSDVQKITTNEYEYYEDKLFKVVQESPERTYMLDEMNGYDFVIFFEMCYISNEGG